MRRIERSALACEPADEQDDHERRDREQGDRERRDREQGDHERSDLLAGFDARSVVEQLPAVVYVADVGIEGRWRYVSEGIGAILGFSPREWMEDPRLWARQVHPDDRARMFSRETDLLDPESPDEYRMLHRNGSTVWVRDEAVLSTDGSGNVRWHGVLLDITDRKLAEIELERRAAQQAAVARLGKRVLEGTELGDLMQEALVEAARALELHEGAVLEQPSGGDRAIVRARLGRCADIPLGESTLVGQIEGREGGWGVLWLAGSVERGFAPADRDFVQALANILADAIRQRAAEDDIRHQALHDPLTGLPNRVLVIDRLGHALSKGTPCLAVVLLDIDNFKLVNDSLGHRAGDELLMEIAPRLATALRPGDTIARLGGDEFVLLLEGIRDEQAATRVARRVIAALERPFQLSAGEHFTKVSLGIAVAGPEDRDPAALISDADAAMYQAKERGRARFEVFDGAMRARMVERLSVENDLRRALERHELRLVYQPIVSLTDGSLVSVEALLRWQHPRRGIVAPAEFVAIAEESGLIEPIGRWVLEEACVQAARWHAECPDRRPLGVSVNLSIRQLRQRDLEQTVLAALQRGGIDPGGLCLELTESVLLQETDGVRDTVTRLARHGVRFVLDDFGTGYSSLAYLTRLPIDGLKIDRSFVEALGSDRRSTAITTAIVRMAQALSVDVIAEGVETERQLRELRSLHCELGQGFRFHKPLSAKEISGLLLAECSRGQAGSSAARAWR